jgi:hypothetical protein
VLISKPPVESILAKWTWCWHLRLGSLYLLITRFSHAKTVLSPMYMAGGPERSTEKAK